MRFLICFLFLSLVLSSCQKEKLVSVAVKSDSVLAASDSTMAVEKIANFKIEPMDMQAIKGKTIFTEDNKVLFYFDTQSNTGEIIIDGKKHLLDVLNFTDNEYRIGGDGIKITATNGAFQDMTSDCLYGKFPEITVEYNQQKQILKNISVQDCPVY